MQKEKNQIKILSVGAAVQDVYLMGALFEPICEEDGVCYEEFKLGSKNELDSVNFSTGGGATNGAVTFARQGFNSIYLGKIGKDVAGHAIIDNLKSEGVDTSLIGYSDSFASGYSCILLAPSGERTILSYRGASSHYTINEEDFKNINPDWIFLTSLEGNFQVIETIFDYAIKNNIKISMNPGKKELQNKDKLKELIPHLTILSMNKEEIQEIYQGDSLEDLVREASRDVHYVIVTDGPNGAVATDRWHLVRAGMYEDVPVIDRTGAGDAFSSGFTAMIAAGETLEWAVTYASANSTSVVSSIGAKQGILHSESEIHEMPLVVSEL